MVLTQHAKARWKERFSDINIDEEYANSRRCGRGTKKKLRKLCLYHQDYITRAFKGYYYLISKNNIIFVMAPKEIVVTCFKLEI